jgi:hypothetical protein
VKKRRDHAKELLGVAIEWLKVPHCAWHESRKGFDSAKALIQLLISGGRAVATMRRRLNVS